MKFRYKITIAYEGTNYSGWQIQPNARTIQALIQSGLEKILRHPVTVVGSGRTDAGVHALGQVAHFSTDRGMEPFVIQAALNGILPFDIRIKFIEPTASNFHAQYSAINKTYHYHLYLEKIDDPFRRPYYLKVKPFDIHHLIEAASIFIGKRDFTSFANEPNAGSVAKNPVRNLKRLDIVNEDGGVRLEFESNGFLYKMVRNIVGTLLEVVSGKRKIEDIPKIFAAKDRRRAGITAAARGLFLVNVQYSQETQMKEIP